MVDELEDLIKECRGSETRTRCFDHIINLVAKSTIQQFDSRNVSNNEADKELRDLAEGLELEEMVTLAEKNVVEKDGEDSEEDDFDMDTIDEQIRLTEAERVRLDESFRPVKMMLVKVGARKLCRINTHLAVTAPKASVRNPPLLDPSPTRVDEDSGESEVSKPHHASRRPHSMEFDIRYAEVRPRVSDGH
jgi:hypothetical protein